ncbi:unnamed protein product, partial [Pleuronectes platessa]
VVSSAPACELLSLSVYADNRLWLITPAACGTMRPSQATCTGTSTSRLYLHAKRKRAHWVIAKVRIHRVGMVQPSALRFLPSAPRPPADTINSSGAAAFSWNPPGVMGVRGDTF